MKLLVICGDTWHPAETVRAGLKPLESETRQFDWLEDSRGWSPDRLKDQQVVIVAKSNQVSPTNPAEWMDENSQLALADFVRRGGGLLAIHAGTALYDKATHFRRLLGGVFSHHPEQCPVSMEMSPNHPLNTGIEPFRLVDEHYFMALDDHFAEVFLTTRSEQGEQPGGWARSEGKGHVAVITPGHNLAIWLHPSFQQLLRNTIAWCGRRGD